MQSPLVVHRAPWVLPVATQPIADGAVVVRAGRITAVGRFRDRAGDAASAAVVEYPDSVLLPGLINGHIHLELSHLAHLADQEPPAGFTDWIENMLDERLKAGFTGKRVEEAARRLLARQQDEGVVALADISNTGLIRALRSDYTGRLLCFKEYIGLRASGLERALQELALEDAGQFCTAHAPYSTHPLLLLALKKRAAAAGHLFPIHVAEPEAEGEMMSLGRGEMPAFLARRGFWDTTFTPTGIDNSGSVQYLHQLGILDAQTICVHCIHVTDEEIDLLVRNGSKVCLCPGSNSFLGVGRAPVARYLQHGLLPALGTDSPASNPEVSLWREMQLLAEDYPEIPSQAILAMATMGGAAAFGLDSDLGSLEPGKEGRMLAVRLPTVMGDGGAVADYLVHGGSEIAVRRV